MASTFSCHFVLVLISSTTFVPLGTVVIIYALSHNHPSYHIRRRFLCKRNRQIHYWIGYHMATWRGFYSQETIQQRLPVPLSLLEVRIEDSLSRLLPDAPLGWDGPIPSRAGGRRFGFSEEKSNSIWMEMRMEQTCPRTNYLNDCAYQRCNLEKYCSHSLRFKDDCFFK